ncbi:aminoglycoside phosphotransferase family protein [Actinoplanes sp. NPDC051411]|uniref:aminoglycoside phosphotransferase family protein n=1 Tax=Actinoplanes sp. NPDC051411 TaxID=3155522 RepID=UPI0034315F84
MKMHDDELDIDDGLVRRLLRAQFPQWAGLPLKPVGAGTAHVMMRLGDDLVVRLPRQATSTDVELEQRWLPVLAPRLPLPVPVPVGFGAAPEDYPARWSVQSWLDGDHDFTDLRSCALQLASFLTALRQVSPAGAPDGYRGGRPTGWDDAVRRGLRDLDVPGGAAFWERSWDVPGWAGPKVWTHGDLLPTNLLASGGRLAAVLDFGCAGAGDPACDLMPAWTLFDDASRPVFRSAADVDDATWERGRAWAFAFGISAWHYYAGRNPPFAELGRRTVNHVLTS